MNAGYVSVPAGYVDPKNISHNMVEYIGQDPQFHGPTHYTGNYHADPLWGNYNLEPHHDHYHDYHPDDHYHNPNKADVTFVEPEPFKPPSVEWETRLYEPYIPKFEKTYVPIDYVYEEVIPEPVFDPHNFYAEDYYGAPEGQFAYDRDAIYDPYLDPLHHVEFDSTSTDETPSDNEKSSSESDGNFVPIEIPGAFAPPHNIIVEEPYVETVVDYVEICDCSEVIAERDALAAELALYKIKYEGYLPDYVEPVQYYGFSHRTGYEDPLPTYDLPVVERKIYTPDQYAYEPLDYAISPLDDPYYSDATVYYEPGDSYGNDPYEFYDYVIDDALDSYA